MTARTIGEGLDAAEAARIDALIAAAVEEALIQCPECGRTVGVVPGDHTMCGGPPVCKGAHIELGEAMDLPHEVTVAGLIAAAVEAERERCAGIAFDIYRMTGSDDGAIISAAIMGES